MALDTTIISQLAQRLEKARLDRVPVPRITDEIPDLSLADAYHIQDALRLIQIGGHASPAGLKMGFTSCDKMAQMKVQDPINGYLTEGGRLPVGGTGRRKIGTAHVRTPVTNAQLVSRLPLEKKHDNKTN